MQKILVTALLALICLAGATPATADVPVLAASTTLRGTGSSSMLVEVPAAARLVTSGTVTEQWMDVTAPDGVTVGFMLEPLDPTAFPRVGVQLPEGFGFGGGPLELDFAGADGQPLSPGTHRVYLLSNDPAADVSLTLRFTGLSGSTVLEPTTPAELVVRADEEVDEVGEQVLVRKRIAGSNGPQAAGGFFITGWTFRGDPGSAVVSHECSLNDGPRNGDDGYDLPICIPAANDGVRGSVVSNGRFIPTGGGAYAYRSHAGLIPEGQQIGVNTSVGVVGAHHDSHAFAVWIDRGQAAPPS